MEIRLVEGQKRDLGGFSVSRVLPAATARHVGPFVFFDHMGPAQFPKGQGMAVRPHPHIGLATITYLFEGAMMHRDSIGSVQEVVPGDVNWMSAGRGVVHSERSPENLLAMGHRVHGIQIWVAQSLAEESAAPTFVHVAEHDLPSRDAHGATLRLIVGKAFGMQAPIIHSLPMFYLHAQLASAGSIEFDPEYPERAVYAVDTPIRIDGTSVAPGTMAVIDHDSVAHITADGPATMMLLGGEPLDAPRRLNWNFVASSQELIDAARASWTSYPNQQFPLVPGETESIPLPAK